MVNSISSLPEKLQRARKARRVSQLELALDLGVSQRHVSFVETGRARPSRELLLAWLQALDLSLAGRNEALLSAGYAPGYSEAALESAELAVAEGALEQLLKAHEPGPAFVLDAEWNLLRMNRGAMWLANMMFPGAAEMIGKRPVNMLDLIVQPDGLAHHVTNLGEVGPAFLAILRREASVHRSILPRLKAYEDFLVSRLGERGNRLAAKPPAAPMLTTRFGSPHGELAFFSMFTTFGTPNDITLASLRVEHMFPADDATRTVLEQFAK